MRVSRNEHPRETAMAITETAPKMLTNITWDQVDTLDPGKNLAWDQQSDLEKQLAPLVPHLDETSVRALVTAAASGLPVMLTWEWPFGEHRVQRITANCLIQWLTVPRDLPGQGMHDVNHIGYAQVRRLGFGGPIYLKNLRKAEFFHAVT